MAITTSEQVRTAALAAYGYACLSLSSYNSNDHRIGINYLTRCIDGLLSGDYATATPSNTLELKLRERFLTHLIREESHGIQDVPVEA